MATLYKRNNYGKGVVGPEVALKKPEMFLYAFGEGGQGMIMILLSMFFMFYATTVVGINAAHVGTMILLARIWDAINDPIMGVLVDRTDTRMGRCRPYLLFASLPLCLFVVMLFAFPVNASYTVKLIWMYVAYIGQNMLFTAIAIPYTSLMPKMTQDPQQRVKLNRNRVTASYLMTLFCSLSIPALLAMLAPKAGAMGNPGAAYTWVIAICMVIPFLLYLVVFFVVKERQFPVARIEGQKESVGLCIKCLVKNKYWVLIALCTLLNYALSGINSTITLYYTSYVLEAGGVLTSLTMVANFLPPLVMMIIIPTVVAKLGKRTSTVCGLVIAAVGLGIRLGAGIGASVAVYLTGLILFNFGIAAFSVTLAPCMMDAMEYSEWRFGIRNESMIISANSLGTKAGPGIASAFVGYVLSAVAFDAATAAGDMVVKQSIFNLAVIVPLVMLLVFLVVVSLFDYDKHAPQIEKELSERRARQAAS